MNTNRSIPNCTVIPELSYPDVGAAVDWLRNAFGFALRIRIAYVAPESWGGTTT